MPTRSPALQLHDAWAIGDLLMALGRVREAEQYHMQSFGSGRYRAWQLANLAYVQGDLDRMRKQLALVQFDAVGPRTYLLMEAGFINQAREVVRTVSLGQQPDEAPKSIAEGDLLLVDGRPAEALPILQAGVAGLKPRAAYEYYSGCGSVAQALKNFKRQPEAVATLEECVRETPRYVGEKFIHATFWERLKLRLADAYREVGRVSDAQRVERELRMLLQYADSDHPLIVQLNRR